MTVLPLVVMTSLPSILIFIGSMVLRRGRPACLPLGRATTQGRPYSLMSQRASLFRNVRVKLVSVLFDKRGGRHCRRVAERANRIAHDVTADVENQIEVVLFSITVLDAVKNLFHPVTTFAAGAALAARLMGEKARQIPRRPDHAGRLVHDNDAARAEQTSRRLDRFIV